MKTNTVKGRIISTRYKSTSYYGNPKYYVSFEDANGNYYTGETANNAACAYSVTNYDLRESCIIDFHYTRLGNLIIDYVRKP